jgi:hypothetical protein
MSVLRVQVQLVAQVIVVRRQLVHPAVLVVQRVPVVRHMVEDLLL